MHTAHPPHKGSFGVPLRSSRSNPLGPDGRVPAILECMSRVPEANVQDESPSARTEEIRAIAADLFETKGYSATTMADIASAAGVLPGSLYHHFDSKEVIAIELLHSLEAELNALAERLSGADARTSPEERLQHLVAEVMILSYRHAAAVRLRTYEPPTVATDRLSEAVRLHADPLDRLWRIAIAELAASSTASAADVRLLRYALQTLAINAAVDHPRRPDPRLLASQLCDLLLRGVATHFDERELDGSAALAIAKAAVVSWGPPPPAAGDFDDVRDEIVAAARREFSRRGYDATTVRDIATSAGVTMGTLYRRAQSKDALLSEVIDSYAGHFDAAARGVLASGSPEPASIDGLIWVFVHAARRFRQESDIVQVGWLDRGSPSSPLYDYFRATEERLALLRAMLARGVRNGTLRPTADAYDVAALIRFVMWLPYQDQTRTSAARAHHFLRRTMLHGFLSAR
jgi:AcrR family transcriptional regulator